MKLQEIMKKYKGKWVLIEFESMDDELNITDGKVIAHSKNKEEIYRKLMQIKGKNIAIEYAGELKEVAVIFYLIEWKNMS